MALVSIKVSEDPLKIDIVNQLLLPHVTEDVSICNVQDAHEAIKSMKVVQNSLVDNGYKSDIVISEIRGAPAIASLAALSVAQSLTRDLALFPEPPHLTRPDLLKRELDTILDFLNTSRPTAVNLGTAVRRLKKKLNDAIAAGKDPRVIAQDVVAEARAVHDEDLQRNKDMAKWAGEWILDHHKVQGDVNILTVCNTGSLATSVCYIFTPVNSCAISFNFVRRVMEPQLVRSPIFTKLGNSGQRTILKQRHTTRVRGEFSCTRFLLMTFTCENNNNNTD